MESLRLLILLALLCIFDFDPTAGKLQIFSGGSKLILKSSKCNKCLTIPHGYKMIIDPGNTRIQKTTMEFAAISKKCRKGDFIRVMGAFLDRASKWCGNNGDKAVEKCCQERLKCPVKQDRPGAKKKSSEGFLFSVRGCECEKKFGICLKNVGNDEAEEVFRFQFRIFPGSCMKFDHPIHCVSKPGNAKTNKAKTKLKCTTDKKKPKKWQIVNQMTGKPERIDFPMYHPWV